MMQPMFMSKAGICQAFGLCTRTVQGRLQEIRKQIPGRYSPYILIEDGNILLISVLAFLDWEKYRKSLLDKNMKKYVPPFRPEELAPLVMRGEEDEGENEIDKETDVFMP